jgi:fused signal recognition particle receptor
MEQTIDLVIASITNLVATISTYIENTPPLYWGIAFTVFFILIVIWLIARRGSAPPETDTDVAIDREKDEEIESPPPDEEQIETVAEVEVAPDAAEETVSEPTPDTDTKASAAEVEVEEPPRRPEPAAAAPPTKTSLMGRLKNGLAKTRNVLTTDIENLFKGKKALDEDLLEDLEELLITADVGVETSMDLIELLSAKRADIKDATGLKAALKSEILSMIDAGTPAEKEFTAKPHVILVVGVNGVGKTTTIGKLAARFNGEGKKVIIAAADTFRAAAIDQLEVWAERSGADIVRHRENSDPAAVAFDSIEAALARGTDVVLIDTAGRLHTKVNLMEELKKIKRTVTKKIPDAPHEVLLVLDATTGQNAVTQAKLFNEALGITAIALTKVDGTAKGGIVISISRLMDTSLKYIGVGEQVGDLQDFESDTFVDAMIN